MKAVPGPKKRSTTEDFMGGSLGGVPGKKTILVGRIIQAFKKYGGGGQCLQGWQSWLFTARLYCCPAEE